jgi:hypothetical protein
MGNAITRPSLEIAHLSLSLGDANLISEIARFSGLFYVTKRHVGE